MDKKKEEDALKTFNGELNEDVSPEDVSAGVALYEQNRDLAVDNGLGVVGMEGVAKSDLPRPFIKLVQENSSDVETADGQKAKVGYWFLSSIAKAYEEIVFTPLAVKSSEEPNYNDPSKLETVYKILGVLDGENEPFIYYARSFAQGAFSRMLGSIVNSGSKAIWEWKIKATSKQMENSKKQSWFVPVFSLSERNSEEMTKLYYDLYKSFSSSLIKQGDSEN